MTVEPRTTGTAVAGHEPANLGDILERVLDRGLVIVGDIRVSLLDIELLTVKLRLLIASVDTAREIGIDWWRHDPWLSGRPPEAAGTPDGDGARAWPWAFRATQLLALRSDAAGAALTITLTIANTGSEAFPFGLGFHPFFVRSAATRLAFTAGSAWWIFIL